MSVLDAVGIGVVIIDTSGEVVLSHSVADELLSRRVESSTLLEVLVESALSAFASEGDTSTNPPPSEETSHQRKIEALDAAGAKSIIGYRSVRSRRLGMIFTLRDITEIEQFRAEKRQLERLSEVGRACAMVAHEIGNPLAAIKATIQSIEREAATAGLQDPISAVYSEIDRLDKTLNQLLGFVRHRPPRKTKSSFSAIVAKASATAEPRMKHVALQKCFSALPLIHVDPDQIAQVLTNLLINAADAMPDGGTVTVSADADEKKIYIRVEDESSGIPKELHDQIFEAFYTTKPAGTGLGLPVCYRIVSDHGGSITLEDRPPGKGTCFWITLPKG